MSFPYPICCPIERNVTEMREILVGEILCGHSCIVTGPWNVFHLEDCMFLLCVCALALYSRMAHVKRQAEFLVGIAAVRDGCGDADPKVN